MEVAVAAIVHVILFYYNCILGVTFITWCGHTMFAPPFFNVGEPINEPRWLSSATALYALSDDSSRSRHTLHIPL